MIATKLRHSASNISGDKDDVLADLKRQMVRLQIENERLKRARTSEPGSPRSTKPPQNAEPAPAKRANPEESPMPSKETTAQPNMKAPAIDPSQLETQIEGPMEPESGEEEEEENDEHDEEKDQDEGVDGEPYDEEEEVAVDSDSEKAAAEQELEAEEERAVEAITRLEMEAQAARERLQELRDRAKPQLEQTRKPLSALAMALKKGAEEHRLKRGEASSHLTLASTTASTASTKVLGAQSLHPSNLPAQNTTIPEPAAEVALVPGSVCQAADPATINTSTHRKEWAKLERMMNSKGSDFPHMAQLFNGRQAANGVHSASEVPIHVVSIDP